MSDEDIQELQWQLAEANSIDDTDDRVNGRLWLLLADFLACSIAARTRPPSDTFAADGASGDAALLALRASADDLDDVDWGTLHHPGSVVWPVAIALGAAAAVDGATLRRAALAGYRTAATMAVLLGTAHRARWHVTATAGAFGAASVAGVLLGLNAPAHERALALTAANVGGSGLAARERLGAAGFNRVAAVTLGIAAARAARAGAPCVLSPLTGEFGLLATMTETPARSPAVVEGVSSAALRVYPVCGFLQSAVAGAARGRSLVGGELATLRLRLSRGAVSLVDGSAQGRWWDARRSIARAWATGDPFAITDASSNDHLAARVYLEVANFAPGESDILITTEGGEVYLGPLQPPFSHSEEDLALVYRKWEAMGVNATEVHSLAVTVIEDNGNVAEMARAAGVR